MSTLRWTGNSVAGAQVDTITLATYDTGTTWTVTIGNKSISQVGTGGTINATALTLQTLLAASTIPEFKEWTWTVVNAVITATFKTPGEAGVISASVSGGTGTVVHAIATANAGPNDFDTTGNFSTGALPVNSDNLIFDTGDNDVMWNLSALSGVTTATLTRRNTYTGTIGLPEYDAASGYYEFRATELTIGATTATIEQPSSDAAAAIKLNFGSVQTALTILGQSAPSLENEQCWWRGTHASNVVNVINGGLAIANAAGTTATMASLNAESSTVRCGSGCTITAANNLNSTMEFNSSPGTYTQNGANAVSYFKLAAGATTANLYGGTTNWNGGGTIGTLTLGNATLDFSQGAAPVTITNTVIFGSGANFNDPDGRVTLGGTPSYQLAAGCTMADVTLNFGPGRSYTVA